MGDGGIVIEEIELCSFFFALLIFLIPRPKAAEFLEWAWAWAWLGGGVCVGVSLCVCVAVKCMKILGIAVHLGVVSGVCRVVVCVCVCVSVCVCLWSVFYNEVKFGCEG